jgi:hypothetical protein
VYGWTLQSYGSNKEAHLLPIWHHFYGYTCNHLNNNVTFGDILHNSHITKLLFQSCFEKLLVNVLMITLLD